MRITESMIQTWINWGWTEEQIQEAADKLRAEYRRNCRVPAAKQAATTRKLAKASRKITTPAAKV